MPASERSGAVPPGEELPWHTALVLALTGVREELGVQNEPDVDAVVDHVTGRTIGHHALPADLLDQLPPARFAALLVEVRRRLSVATPPRPGRRPLDRHDRDLLADRPPHWG